MTYDTQSKYKTVISQSISITLLTQRSQGPAHKLRYDLYRDRSIYKADIDVNSCKSASPDGVFTGITSPIYRTRSFISGLRRISVTLNAPANAELLTQPHWG